MFLGTTEADSFRAGSSEVDKIMLGDVEVYPLAMKWSGDSTHQAVYLVGIQTRNDGTEYRWVHSYNPDWNDAVWLKTDKNGLVDGSSELRYGTNDNFGYKIEASNNVLKIYQWSSSIWRTSGAGVTFNPITKNFSGYTTMDFDGYGGAEIVTNPDGTLYAINSYYIADKGDDISLGKV